MSGSSAGSLFVNDSPRAPHSSAHDLSANSEIIRHAVESDKLKVIEAEYELDSDK